MKSFIIAISLMASSAAFAKKIEIARYYEGAYHSYSAEYQINPEMGRAWIAVTLGEYDSEGINDSIKVKVPGLAFDTIKSQIVFKDGEKNTACANVRLKSSIFKPTKIKTTKACKFSKEVETKMVDDGFTVKQLSYDVLYLNVF